MGGRELLSFATPTPAGKLAGTPAANDNPPFHDEAVKG
jgi:hypothetical protein